jgi:hypothetical protein
MILKIYILKTVKNMLFDDFDVIYICELNLIIGIQIARTEKCNFFKSVSLYWEDLNKYNDFDSKL